MTRHGRLFLVTAAAATFAATAIAAPGNSGAHGGGKGKPARAVVKMTVPEGAADANARGTIDVKHFPAVGKRAERSWFRVKLGRLDGVGTEYTLWTVGTADDPATLDVDETVAGTQIGALTANGDGAARLMLDTKKGDALPLGGTLADLGGKAVEVHDAAGLVVLTATLPAVQ
jgi:hypothetical protein